MLHDGRLVGTVRKRYLPNYGVFDENRYFMAERRSLVFARDGMVFGVNVCEDIWLSGGPSEEQVVRGGAEVILNLSASPYHAGKAGERRRMISTRAADNQAIVCYVNLVGAQDEIVFDGSSLILDERGRVLAEGAAFAEDLVVADVDLDEVVNARVHDPRVRQWAPGTSSGCRCPRPTRRPHRRTRPRRWRRRWACASRPSPSRT